MRFHARQEPCRGDASPPHRQESPSASPGLLRSEPPPIGDTDDRDRYRDFFEATSDWFWETDAAYRFTFMSEQFSAATGIPVGHLLGRTRIELARAAGMTSEELAPHLADIEARRPFRGFCYRLADPATGGDFHIKVSGNPVFGRDGAFLGYRGSGTDITKEMEALKAAEQARLYLTDAIESFSEALALFDANDRLVFANGRFRDLYQEIAEHIVPGITFEELARRKFEAGLFADALGSVEDCIRWYTSLHRNQSGAGEIQLSDGRWVRISDRRTSGGGIVSVRTDITELKRRERALVKLSDELRVQNLRFDTALNNMVQGLCMFDAEQKLIVCNQRYLEMYGFSPRVVKPGISLREIMEYSVSLGNYRLEDAAQAIAERPTHAAKREQAILHQRLTDGRVIAVMHQPMTDGGSVATYEDVTQTVRAEEALREYASKLEQSNRELQDFASVASHDLQEPLRKIEAFADRLKAKCSDELSEAGRNYIDRMQDAARRMRLLINDLLTYSRVTTKARPFAKLSLTTLVSEVMSDLQITIEQAQAKIVLENLPEIEADATQIRQLMQNLLSNALKFRAEGVPPVIRIAGRVLQPARPGESGGLCEIVVSDNGIGFEQKYADRIFGIFQRLHGRNEYEGTGIGLATCRKIVERHGGSILASSAPGQGATFTLKLPISRHGGEILQ